jgi:hypothetical protein
MSRYSGHDPYLDPASGVLKNRFGIAHEPTLEATEACSSREQHGSAPYSPTQSARTGRVVRRTQKKP